MNLKLKLGFINKGINTGATGGSGGVSSYTISGTVYDADGSTAVTGATVALGALTATSAANGTYTISNVPAGTSGSMTCTKTGYSWTAITVAAMSGNLISQNYTNKWWAAGGGAATAVFAHQPKGAAGLAVSYQNIINPGTNDIVPQVAPDWNATDGWINTGTQWLQTPVVSSCRVVVVRFSGFGSGALAGKADTYLFEPNKFGANVRYLGASSQAPAITGGVLAVSSDGGWRNGTKEIALAFAGSTQFMIFSRNGGNDIATAGKVQAVAGYSNITDAQVGAVMAAIVPL